PFEGHLIEEAKRRNRDLDRTGREFFLVGQIDLVGANLLFSQVSRGFAEVTGKTGHLQEVGKLGIQGEVTDLHVLEHALPKNSHEKLLFQMDGLKNSHSMLI